MASRTTALLAALVVVASALWCVAPVNGDASSMVQAASTTAKERAYVAFLCNEGMLLPILVLVRSLVRTGTEAAVFVMVTDGVPPAAREKIRKEGAGIVDAPDTPYPFESSEKRKKMFKPCRCGRECGRASVREGTPYGCMRHEAAYANMPTLLLTVHGHV